MFENTFVNEMFIDSDNMSINPYCAGYFYILHSSPIFIQLTHMIFPVTAMYTAQQKFRRVNKNIFFI